jgi:hypothetical protein
MFLSKKDEPSRMNSTTFFNDIRDLNKRIEGALKEIGDFIAENKELSPAKSNQAGGNQYKASRKRHRILGTKWGKSNE